jgi:hypothetical protein
MNFHERRVYGDVPYHDLFGLPGEDENSPRFLKCKLNTGSLDVASSKARVASNSSIYTDALLRVITKHATIVQVLFRKFAPPSKTGSTFFSEAPR